MEPIVLGLGNNSQDEKQNGGDANGTGSACNTLSSNQGNNNGGSAAVTMNHINAAASGSKPPSTSDTLSLVRRLDTLSEKQEQSKP